MIDPMYICKVVHGVGVSYNSIASVAIEATHLYSNFIMYKALAIV